MMNMFDKIPDHGYTRCDLCKTRVYNNLILHWLNIAAIILYNFSKSKNEKLYVFGS